MASSKKPEKVLQLALAAGVCLYTNASFASLQDVAEAPLATRSEQLCRINADTSADCTIEDHITVLRPSGRDLVSRLDFDYREDDRFEVVDAAVIQPDGKRLSLSPSQIDTRSTPNPADGLRRELRTSLAFPGLRVGSTVTYKIVQHSAAIPHATHFHRGITFGAKPVRFDSFRMEYVADRPILWRAAQANAFRIEAFDQGKRLRIALKKPYFYNTVNEDDLWLRQAPRIELGSSLSVQDNFGVFARRYAEILAAPLPPEAAAAVRAARDKPAKERVAALLKHIDSHYRYLGDWRASDRGYIPLELAQIEANGYGDCKDLAVLLVAMLNASGIDARPAWTFAGSFAPPLLIPGINAPNHAIVRAAVDGEVWWLDATVAFLNPGRTFDHLQDRWAFVAENDGSVREDYINTEPPTSRFDSAFEYRIEPDGSAMVEGRAYLGGDLLQQFVRSDRHAGASAVDQSLCSKVFKEPGECVVDRPSTDEPWSGRYRIDISGKDRRALSPVSGQLVYESKGLAFLGEKLDRFAHYRRHGDVSDIYLRDASMVEGTIRLHGVKLSQAVPECQIRSRWYDVDMRPEPVDGGVSYRYRVVEKQRWLDHETLTSAVFGDFIDEARRCIDSLSQTVIFERPDLQQASR